MIRSFAAEPADPELLPPMLKGFGAVPPLVTDINLSLDDKNLYVSCFGSGEFRRYDVNDPFHPKLSSKISIGGIVARAAHPSNPGRPLNGGPQMVGLSRDGRRVYVTNFPVHRGGRAVLSGRREGLDDEDRRGSEHRRNARRSAVLSTL